MVKIKMQIIKLKKLDINLIVQFSICYSKIKKKIKIIKNINVRLLENIML